MRKHLIILLALTLFLRGIMFLSYPLSGLDDNQAAQRYLIDQLLSGNLYIGNLRYQTGYPLAIAPVVGVSQLFGRLDERVVLLVQIALSSLIPFIVYDLLRRRSRREAFIVAFVVTLDPFGWQWAHFWLPEWWVAFCVMLALWLVVRGLNSRRGLLWVGAVGLLLGAASLARLNLVPVVAALGTALLLARQWRWRARLAAFATLGMTSIAVLGLYVALIHLPSTGTTTLSCISATSLIESLLDKNIVLSRENGATTARLLDLLALPTPREYPFLSDSYPLWATPGPWVDDAEREAFLRQPPGAPPERLTAAFPGHLYYLLGPCATDSLLRGVYDEALAHYPLQIVAGNLVPFLAVLTQSPTRTLQPRYLPSPYGLETSTQNGLGFVTADGVYYSGQELWLPGIWVYTTLFALLHPLKWLTPLALVWAWARRDWLYGTAAWLLLVASITIAWADSPEPRIYAAVYPLTPFLLGGMLVWALRRFAGR